MVRARKCPNCHGTNTHLGMRWVRFTSYYCRTCAKTFEVKKVVRAPKNFICSDGGFAESQISDRKNCAVRASAIAMDIPYKDADALFELAGRTRHDGTRVHTMDKAYNLATDFGFGKVAEVRVKGSRNNYGRPKPAPLFCYDELELPEPAVTLRRDRFGYQREYTRYHHPVTLAMVRERLGAGRYILTSARHAFALIDGDVHDRTPQGPNTVITNIWRITK